MTIRYEYLFMVGLRMSRSIHQRYYIRKAVLKKRNILGKTRVLESLFNKVAGRPEDLQFYQNETPTKAVFLWILQNVYKHLFLQNNPSGCFQISIKGWVPFHCCSFFVANHSSFPHRFTSLFVCSPCKNQSLLAAKSLVTYWKIIRSLLQKPLLALAKNHSSVVVKITCYKNHSSLITNITRYSLHINFTASFNLVSFDEEKWKTIYSHFSKIMSMLCFHAIATKRALHRILFSVL